MFGSTPGSHLPLLLTFAGQRGRQKRREAGHVESVTFLGPVVPTPIRYGTLGPIEIRMSGCTCENLIDRSDYIRRRPVALVDVLGDDPIQLLVDSVEEFRFATPPAVYCLFDVTDAQEGPSFIRLHGPFGEGAQHLPLIRRRILKLIQEEVINRGIEAESNTVHTPKLFDIPYAPCHIFKSEPTRLFLERLICMVKLS